MSEEINYIPEPHETFEQVPEKKKSKTVWIIVAIVAVILLCCCLVIVFGTVLGFLPVMDEMLNEFMFESVPYLTFL